MKVAVWDTYVTRKDGKLMHFDIIVPEALLDEQVIYNYGQQYLSSKGESGQQITSKECRFCHFENVKPQWSEEILRNGYYIYEMENCN